MSIFIPEFVGSNSMAKTVAYNKKFGRVQELGVLYNDNGEPKLNKKMGETMIFGSMGELQPGDAFSYWKGNYFFTNTRFIFIGSPGNLPLGRNLTPLTGGARGIVSVGSLAINMSMQDEETKWEISRHIRRYAGFRHEEISTMKKTFLGNYQMAASAEGKDYSFTCTFKDKNFKKFLMEQYKDKI